MKYLLRNVSDHDILIGDSILIPQSEDLVLYDDETLDIHPYIDVILSATENSYSNLDASVNYNVANSMLWFYIDEEYQVSPIFYKWLINFKSKYKVFKKYRANGIVDIRLDIKNDVIVFSGSNIIPIPEIPDHIPAEKISTGIVSNDEFDTLSGIDTSKTIKEQLDGKSDIVHNHTYLFFLSYPSLTWTLNHGLNVKPAIEIRDLDGEVVQATVRHEDENTIFMKFSRPTLVYVNLTI